MTIRTLLPVWAWLGALARPHRHDMTGSADAELKASQKGIRAVRISLVGLGVTAMLQAVIALISGSVALLADTVHNLADALTALVRVHPPV